MRSLPALLLVGLFVGCSGPAPEKPQDSAERVAPPADEARRLPQTGLTHMELVPEHLLGKTFMPGGNIATYKNGKLAYQEFLGRMPDAQKAAFLLLDWQKALEEPKYLAHMGGYFGMSEDRPVYVFTKGAWVAGVVGLPEAKADGLARELAARL